MMRLPGGWKRFKIGFVVFDTIPAVTDRQTDRHVAVASTRYAYLRRAVKIPPAYIELSVGTVACTDCPCSKLNVFVIGIFMQMFARLCRCSFCNRLLYVKTNFCNNCLSMYSGSIIYCRYIVDEKLYIVWTVHFNIRISFIESYSQYLFFAIR